MKKLNFFKKAKKKAKSKQNNTNFKTTTSYLLSQKYSLKMIYNIKSTLILLFSLICLVDFGLSWQCINQLISCPDLPSPLNGYRASDFNLIAFNDFFANNGEVQGSLKKFLNLYNLLISFQNR